MSRMWPCWAPGLYVVILKPESVLSAIARIFLLWQWAHSCVLVTAITFSSSEKGRSHYYQDSCCLQVPGTMNHSWRQSWGARLLGSWRKRDQETGPEVGSLEGGLTGKKVNGGWSLVVHNSTLQSCKPLSWPRLGCTKFSLSMEIPGLSHY